MTDAAPALPPRFVDGMRALLGPEADAFLASYGEPPTAGLRINPAKITLAEVRQRTGWQLPPVPWCPTGAYIDPADRPGAHPYHAAGLYYLQEPSAMAVAEALRVAPGQRVLDLASAPGGKSTHLASLLAGAGLLVANEVHPARIKPLGENLERWGAPNVVITNSEIERLPGGFDRVLLDAPCSGEGMFRRDPAAIGEWSPERVTGSAERQLRLLRAAAEKVAPGGLLLYSTCTFNMEENEEVVARFLTESPGWEAAPIPRATGMAPGITTGTSAERMARLWPHRLRGEGHTLTLLEAPTGVDNPVDNRSKSRKVSSGTPDSGAETTWRAVVTTCLTSDPCERWGGHLAIEGDRLMLRSALDVELRGARVVRNGLWLATVKPGRVEPSHALALALSAGDALQRLDLTIEQAAGYLAGHPIEGPGPAGWVLVTGEGFPLGWGKRTGSTVKNHYPKGLRRPLA